MAQVKPDRTTPKEGSTLNTKMSWNSTGVPRNSHR